jgi:hypothetical protein
MNKYKDLPIEEKAEIFKKKIKSETDFLKIRATIFQFIQTLSQEKARTRN